MPKSFYDLNIWKKGYELLMEVYKITESFPREEKFNLTSQFRSSANSIIANIAESHGRYYFADKIRVLYISRGECEETRSHLRVALRLEYVKEEKYSYLDNEYEGLSKGINAYINSIRKDG